MSRIVTVGAAQSGPIQRDITRAEALDRLIDMLRKASRRGCDLVVFTECALTPFFPHWWIEDEEELDSYFEQDMPGPNVQPLFDEAARLKIGFHLGYAELAIEDGRKRRFNSSVLVSPKGQVLGHFRKVHLPGHQDYRPADPFQNLEKRYFEPGNLGFPTWRAFGGVLGMCICNDRRWPETYRVLALGGAEMILLGYNTPLHNPERPETDHLASFHHQLCIQSGAYQNGSWVVSVAKAGEEAGVHQLGQTSIVAPSGQIVAQATSLEDELIVFPCDLDETRVYKQDIFNFARNRQPGLYRAITEQKDAVSPE